MKSMNPIKSIRIVEPPPKATNFDEKGIVTLVHGITKVDFPQFRHVCHISDEKKRSLPHDISRSKYLHYPNHLMKTITLEMPVLGLEQAVVYPKKTARILLQKKVLKSEFVPKTKNIGSNLEKLVEVQEEGESATTRQAMLENAIFKNVTEDPASQMEDTRLLRAGEKTFVEPIVRKNTSKYPIPKDENRINELLHQKTEKTEAPTYKEKQAKETIVKKQKTKSKDSLFHENIAKNISEQLMFSKEEVLFSREEENYSLDRYVMNEDEPLLMPEKMTTRSGISESKLQPIIKNKSLLGSRIPKPKVISKSQQKIKTLTDLVSNEPKELNAKGITPQKLKAEVKISEVYTNIKSDKMRESQEILVKNPSNLRKFVSKTKQYKISVETSNDVKKTGVDNKLKSVSNGSMTLPSTLKSSQISSRTNQNLRATSKTSEKLDSVSKTSQKSQTVSTTAKRYSKVEIENGKEQLQQVKKAVEKTATSNSKVTPKQNKDIKNIVQRIPVMKKKVVSSKKSPRK